MATIHLPSDFKEFLKLLNAHQVEYLLIGGYAVKDRSTLGSDPSATTVAYSVWAATSLLPSIYDYAGAYNAVNPVLYNLSCPRISTEPQPSAGQKSESFAWRVHIRTTHNLWCDTQKFQNSGGQIAPLGHYVYRVR